MGFEVRQGATADGTGGDVLDTFETEREARVELEALHGDGLRGLSIVLVPSNVQTVLTGDEGLRVSRLFSAMPYSGGMNLRGGYNASTGTVDLLFEDLVHNLEQVLAQLERLSSEATERDAELARMSYQRRALRSLIADVMAIDAKEVAR